MNNVKDLLLKQIKQDTETYMTMLDTIDGKMPCSITDDPLNDYSHYEEGTGPYKQTEEEDCFDAFKEERDRAQPPEKDPNEPDDYESKTHGY